jgi:hypothetical protein
MKWTTESIKTLGVYINTDSNRMINDNFKPKLQKIEQLFKIWNLRKLTLKGKIIIANTLAISQLLYIASVLYTPQWVITEYKNLITKFIWNDKPPKIKYLSLINTIDNGGLKLQDFETKISAIKIKWIQNMANYEISKPWKSYLQTYFDINVNLVPHINYSKKNIPKFHDPFYEDLFQNWCKIHSTVITSAKRVVKEIIWHN